MAHSDSLPDPLSNPRDCPHLRYNRLGIQLYPFPPFRLYLLTCAACGTTVTTKSLREAKEGT